VQTSVKSSNFRRALPVDSVPGFDPVIRRHFSTGYRESSLSTSLFRIIWIRKSIRVYHCHFTSSWTFTRM